MSEAVDLKKLAGRIRKTIKDEGDQELIKVGSDLPDLNTPDPAKVMLLPDWFQKATGIFGIPYGNLMIVAGKTDSGKTTFCIEAMRAAQAQDTYILYVETERKTHVNDLKAAGIDADKVMLVQEKIAEKAYKGMFKWWEGFKEAYPDKKLLIIIDSLGNLISKRDASLDTEDPSQLGGAGKTNRRVINKMISKMDEDGVAVLVVTYIYANLGAPGTQIAGGNALAHSSCLSFETRRTGWVTKTRNGKEIRVGAKFKWTYKKNHLVRAETATTLDWEIKDSGVTAK